jgi:uncharacterized protein YecE (DUF72 family)
MSERHITVGTAAWAIPKQYNDAFAKEGSHLVRYAGRFNGVEINSSFYGSVAISGYGQKDLRAVRIRLCG